jgi:hypothetical protein
MNQNRISAANFGDTGFIRTQDVAQIASNANTHTFKIVYAGGIWQIYSCYFGGKVATYTQIPGPSREDWVSADISAHIRGKNNIDAPVRGKENLVIRTSRIMPVMRKKIVWNNASDIMPSFKLHDYKYYLNIDKIMPKH